MGDDEVDEARAGLICPLQNGCFHPTDPRGLLRQVTIVLPSSPPSSSSSSPTYVWSSSPRNSAMHGGSVAFAATFIQSSSSTLARQKVDLKVEKALEY